MKALSASTWPRRWLTHVTWAVVAGAAFALGTATNSAEPTSAADESPTPTAAAEASPIESAVEECAASSLYIEVLDDGEALSIDGAGDDGVGASIDEIACILAAIDVPDAVVSRMDGTRALDGMQDASWGDLSASWTYHPDDGLDVIVETSR